MDFTNINIVEILTIVICLVIAIVGHEIAHGLAAYKFGDMAAKNQNRLSINPIRHIDMFGTIIIPAALYLTSGFVLGWAKPVPVNLTTVMRNGGHKGAIIVALAGIAYNFILAAFAFFVLKFLNFGFAEAKFIYTFLVINLFLGLFNLYPIPPLDGSKALEYALRSFRLSSMANLITSLEKYGFIILVVILISPFKEQFFAPITYIFKLLHSML
ncbi:site-2 protease family protein [Campylobacter sp. 7477a]|uniref:site-2 protease family protein n=1 Tax=Campylobacter sp. 7477a TaxID=2735741 RepID=UPI0030146F09|nr:site-2 protease family protein [Campylobacter sp. 7477a]